MIVTGNYTDKELIAFLGRQESQDISWGSEYKNDLSVRLRDGRILRGDTLPWSKTHNLFRFGEGKITIWAGMNGHKKSMISGYVALHLARSSRVGVSSFEMPVIDTMERMVYQSAGCTPSPAYGEQWANWSHERICFYDKLDTVPSSVVLGSVYYMAQELKCKHIFIDSLTKCGLPSGDKAAEKHFIDTLAATAKALKIHIHLVAHVRKPASGGEEYIPNKFDVRGAGEITDLVDNVFVCWDDKRKRQLMELQAAGQTLGHKDLEYLDRPDYRLICAKQRGWGWEGNIALWFDSASMQFLAGENHKARNMEIAA